MFVFIPPILVLSIFAILWSYFKWTNRRFIKLTSKIKGPTAYPLIGSALEFVGTPTHVMGKFTKFLNEYGTEPYILWMGPFPIVFLSKPDDIQVILSSSKALKKAYFYEFLKPLLGDGLVTAPVDKWKKHRRIINPAFNAKLLEQFFVVFNQQSVILIENLKKKLDETCPFNLWDYLLPNTLDTICQTAMGSNPTQKKTESEFKNAILEFQKMYTTRSVSPWLYPNIINSVYERLLGTNKLYNSVYKFPLQIIMEKKQAFTLPKTVNNVKDEYEQKENNLKIFLDILLELNNAGANFSDDDLKDEVITMLVTGSETTANTSCFCLLMLAIHQDVQDDVYDEIYNMLGDGDENLSIEDINKLPFLEQVLMETLRLYPVVPMIFRELEDDIKIGDLILPKGITVSLFPYSTHRSPELYSNPSAFCPENFNRENIAKRHKYSYLPFSGGARGCIGSKYAMLSLKVIMCKFLQNFSIHTDLKLSDIQLTFDITLRSATGFPVTIRARDRKPTFKRKRVDY